MALRIRRLDKGVGTSTPPRKPSQEGQPAAKNSLVVFISDTPRSREAKLAYGLNSAGWDVVLLHRDAPTFDVGQDFIDARHYNTPAEALRLAQTFRARIYHLFSNWNFATASVVIRNKPGKVVFDNYDVLAGMVRESIAEKKYPGQLALERYCLEQADGLCCRSLETQVARRTMGYAYKGRRLFFPDYCWDDDAVTICRREPDPCRVANIGNLYIDAHHDIDHARNFHLKLALILEKHNIGSHLYKTSLDRDLTTHFYRATRVSPMILLRNLSYGDLLKEVSTLCHAGLICAPQGITSENQRDLPVHQKTVWHRKQSLRLCRCRTAHYHGSREHVPFLVHQALSSGCRLFTVFGRCGRADDVHQGTGRRINGPLVRSATRLVDPSPYQTAGRIL